MRIDIALLTALLAPLGTLHAAEIHAAAPVKLRCDWESYIGAYSPRWEDLPARAFDAPIIGNGSSGTYLIQDPESGDLRFEMSRNDLCDVRRDFRVRKPNGWFRLRFPDGSPKVKCRLNLYRAQIEADITSGDGSWKVTAFSVPGRDVILYEMERISGSGGVPDWDFVPDDRLPRTVFPPVPAEMKPYPPQARSVMDGCMVSVQEMPVDAAYHTEKEPAPSQHAVAWRVVTEGTRTRIFSAVAHSYRASTAARDAVTRVNQAYKNGFDSVREEHRAWWRAYYAKSFVSIPSQFERWHVLQLYKIGSMTSPDSITDLWGPWHDIDTIWNGIWYDWNTEKMYSSVFTANHPELADAVLNFLWKSRDVLYDPESGGYAQHWGAVSANDGGGRYLGKKADDPAILAWLLSLAYERYQCTMDAGPLLEKAVPLMVGAVKYYKTHLLFTGDDGKLHVKARQSPEFSNPQKKSQFEDTAFQLSGLRWLCRTLISIHQRYSVPAAGVREYSELLENLAPYCIDSKEGFMIGKGQPFNVAHRHDSHELAIWPYLEYLPSNPAQAEVIHNTIDTHRRVGFQGEAAMARIAWGLFSAMLGRGDDAVSVLPYTFSNRMISPHTTRCLSGGDSKPGKGTGYCEEGPFFVDRLIEELLLQSWGDGVIRVFPAIPAAPEWKDVAFHDFLAKGAFLVSAKRDGGITRFIQVQSLAGEPCSVQTGMAGPLRIMSDCGATLDDLGNGTVRIHELGRGHWCVLYSGDALPEGRSLLMSPRPRIPTLGSWPRR